MDLKQLLIKKGKRSWLDIGCGKVFDSDFYYADILPKKKIKPRFKKRYSRFDILNARPSDIAKLGKFDLVRMQHVLEHFTFEEGLNVLKNCAKILKKGGYLLVTVPDLKIHTKKYLTGKYKDWEAFSWWALKRIPDDAPDSFYFSIFAYSIPNKPPFHNHKWCYDCKGLEYVINWSGRYKKIKEIKPKDKLANIPFTHNRPEEDLCIIAQKK